jgi:membrane-associated PAP2 superfamily phosphatase
VDFERRHGIAGRTLGPPSHWKLLLWPTLLYLCLLALLRLGDVDHAVARFFAAPGQQGFPLRHAFVTEFLFHDTAQAVMKLVMAVLLMAWLGSWLNARLARHRLALGYLVLTGMLGVSLVGLGKQLSNVDCPWDLEAFGGSRAPQELPQEGAAGAPVGHCFPGGHSSSGFALFGLFFLARRRRSSLAVQGLLLALFLGSVFAIDQWARGAHFPSHDLTTAYVCWLTALAGDYWLLRPGGRVLHEEG